jgi:16S rRNA (cytidine1402-2'-O)-methyltransferase
MRFMAGTLYLVSTPIGNLEDITLRALRILTEVDLIACEDTRHSRILLDHYSIKTKTISYHEHNERERAIELSSMIESGTNVALITDAGTPGINDPGFRLVTECIKRNIDVVPIPGPAAFVSSLVASGLPTDQFFFGGFLPSRSLLRRLRFEQSKTINATLIFYEAPHRLAESLDDAWEILGEREAAIARELTKLHEEIVRGKLSELKKLFPAGRSIKGEIVLIIDRNPILDQDDKTTIKQSIADRVHELEKEGLDNRAALKRIARELGIPRSEAYRRLLAERALKDENPL